MQPKHTQSSANAKTGGRSVNTLHLTTMQFIHRGTTITKKKRGSVIQICFWFYFKKRYCTPSSPFSGSYRYIRPRNVRRSCRCSTVPAFLQAAVSLLFFPQFCVVHGGIFRADDRWACWLLINLKPSKVKVRIKGNIYSSARKQFTASSLLLHQQRDTKAIFTVLRGPLLQSLNVH